MEEEEEEEEEECEATLLPPPLPTGQDDYKGFFPRKKVRGGSRIFSSPTVFSPRLKQTPFSRPPFSTSPAIERSLFHLHLVPPEDVASRLSDQG